MKIQIRGFNDPECLINNTPLCIGTEGCVNKFVYDIEDLLAKNHVKDSTFIMITPRVSQEYSQIVESLISQVYKRFKVIYTVINDYGLLYQMKKYNFNNFILGRTLIRSLSYTPWNEQIVNSEECIIKKNILSLNIIHKSKIELLKSMGVIGVELCQNPFLNETLEYLHENDLLGWLHYDTIIGAVGRTCPYVRLRNQKSTNCTKQCSKEITLKLVELWSDNLSNKLINERLIYDLTPQYICKENAVYYIPEKVIIPPTTDMLIYDYFFDKKIIEDENNSEIKVN